jgi:probable HAF family extracellular repeat protein
MNSKTWTRIIALSLFAALAIPVQLAAQDRTQPQHQYHHYQLIDVGTFGGPQSLQYIYAPARGVLNNSGALGGWADTATIDPLCFFDYPDCYAAHAFVWQNGAKADLGVLPGGLNSQANWISANGLIAGVADNGQMDLLQGIPQLRGTFWGHDGGITDVGTLPGAYFAFPFAVNSRGEVVGQAANTIPDPYSMIGLGYQSRAFYWKNGVMQDLGTLGTGTDAFAFAINDQGQVLGWSYINSVPNPICAAASYFFGFFPVVLTTSSFIWDKKNGMRDLGSLGGTCTLADDLNDHGQIVGGSSLTGDPVFHPFVWEAATGVTDLLGASNGNSGIAFSISSRGEVVGVTCDSVTCYAVLWRKSGGKWQRTDLSTITDAAYASSINSSEQVVGQDCQDFCQAFLWEDGGPLVDLNTLVPPNSGLLLVEPGQINDRGEVSVTASDASGNNHVVLLIPCDKNHPGVEGCDYSLVDASTAAQSAVPRSVPNGTLHPLPSRLSNRFHIPGQRSPGK